MSEMLAYTYNFGQSTLVSEDDRIRQELECAALKFQKNNQKQKVSQLNIERYYLAAGIAKDKGIISEAELACAVDSISAADSSKLDAKGRKCAQEAQLMVQKMASPDGKKQTTPKFSYDYQIKETLEQDPTVASVGKVTSALYLDFMKNKIDAATAAKSIKVVQHAQLDEHGTKLRDKFMHGECFQDFHNTVKYMSNPQSVGADMATAEKKRRQRENRI